MEMIQKKIEGLGHTIGGVYCPEIRDDKRRTGFKIIDIVPGVMVYWQMLIPADPQLESIMLIWTTWNH
jgi:NTPase